MQAPGGFARATNVAVRPRFTGDVMDVITTVTDGRVGVDVAVGDIVGVRVWVGLGVEVAVGVAVGEGVKVAEGGTGVDDAASWAAAALVIGD